jgi:hypothetical protein
MKDIGETLGGPLDATEIRLTGSARASQTGAHMYEVELVVDVKDLELQINAGRHTGTLNVAALPDTVKSKSVPLQTIPCSYTDAQFQALLQSGLKVRIAVPAQEPPRRIRIAVQDSNSGKVGSLWIPLS